ncbi:hypothetical protein AAON49_01055 [Pseudotenacibaculum sp. MALMAid0570]|uniref:hypothetical protein n=1 Tax=Pseudotenacibaculum sp. MALMAid0570 TaxID=3143938 RepID=UPI0032DFB6C2
MDLAKYKKAWENQPEDQHKISAIEIYKMTQTKSTSIAKWIFIIGLLEFTLWIILSSIFSHLDAVEVYEKLGLMKYINFAYYFNYVVVVLFLIIFYRNYSSVSTIEDTKTLMRRIIKVRKTVKFYVYYNIIVTTLMMIIVNIIIINTPGAIEEIFSSENISMEPDKLLSVYILSQTIAFVVVILFLLLFYYLLYGILLKKLKRNYKELTKLEEVN